MTDESMNVGEGVKGHPARPAIGRKLREARQSLNLTLRDVAEGAGLSTGFISQAERDIAVPSLVSLHNICQVLGVSVQEVLPEAPPAPEASRRTERPLLRLKAESAAPGYERVSTTFPGSVLSSVVIHEAPGYRSEPQSHEGEELFFVLEGSVTVELENDRILLSAGDSLHFSSRRRHATWNHTDQIATMLHVCTMDVFGDRIAAEAEVPGVHVGHEEAIQAAEGPR